MKFSRLFIVGALFWLVTECNAFAFDYPTYSKTLSNGLKIIVCEKPTNNMVEAEVWYRTGSKDENDSIRGMAHMFEHMMFRGSKNYMGEGDVFIDSILSFGGDANAYTTYDRTVYHETIPMGKLSQVLNMEADRMNNLVLSQKTLDVEREVVGEELRDGENNWFRKMDEDIYDKLYPDGHPYRVDVIGYLPIILKFTTQQCQRFYDNFYSPNNAVLIIVGNVKKDEVFALAEKSFGGITKQVHPHAIKNIPDIFSDTIRQSEFTIDFPVQIYGYEIPSPGVKDPGFFSFMMLKDLLFSNPNSILHQRLVNEAKVVYGIEEADDGWSLYPGYSRFYLVMNAQLGNGKVKKMIAAEIQSIIDDGIDQQDLNDYVSNIKAQRVFEAYSNGDIASILGMAELYFDDYNQVDKVLSEFEKITPTQLQQAAKKYFNPQSLKIVNIKPAE